MAMTYSDVPIISLSMVCQHILYIISNVDTIPQQVFGADGLSLLIVPMHADESLSVRTCVAVAFVEGRVMLSRGFYVSTTNSCWCPLIQTYFLLLAILRIIDCTTLDTRCIQSMLITLEKDVTSASLAPLDSYCGRHDYSLSMTENPPAGIGP